MFCWGRKDKLFLNDQVGSEANNQEDRNILQAINRKKTYWIGNNLRRNCLLKHVFGGKIEVMGR